MASLQHEILQRVTTIQDLMIDRDRRVTALQEMVVIDRQALKDLQAWQAVAENQLQEVDKSIKQLFEHIPMT